MDKIQINDMNEKIRNDENEMKNRNGGKFFRMKFCMLNRNPLGLIGNIVINLLIVALTLYLIIVVFPNAIETLALFFIDLIVYIVCLVALFKVVCCDPGFLKPCNITYQEVVNSIYIKKDVLPYVSFSISQKRSEFRKGIKNESPEMQVNSNQDVNICLKYCNTCMLIRDLRVFHCDRCGVCVTKHGMQIEIDHHCPWLSICIGLYNHKKFLIYLFILWTHCLIYIITHYFIIMEAVRKNKHIERISAYFLIIITTMVFVFITVLLFVQIKLISGNITTSEYLRKVYLTISNPFDLGCKQNWNIFMMNISCKIDIYNIVYSSIAKDYLKRQEFYLSSKNTHIELNESYDSSQTRDLSQSNYNQNNINRAEIISYTSQNY